MNRQPEAELMDLPHEADAYARADFAGANDAFVSRLLELTGHRASLHALDLGCGPADIPIRLLRQKSDWRITACDASDAMLRIASDAVDAANLREKIYLLRADAKRVPLPKQSFQVVFSNSLLHHVSEPIGLWKEVKRLIAPAGIIFLRDLARPADAMVASALVARHAGNESPLLQAEFHRSLLAAYTLDEVCDQLREAQLHHLKIAMSSDRHFDVWNDCTATETL